MPNVCLHFFCNEAAPIFGFVHEGRLKKNPDYLVTLIKMVGGYLAEITTF